MQSNVSPQFIDTHCHLEMQQFDHDRDDVIRRAKAAGITAMITVGSDSEGIPKAIELAGRHDDVYAAIGIHPHDSRRFDGDTESRLRKWASNSKVVALGETGLDYHYDHSPREIQREVFRKHLAMSGEYGLPVIIHSREADDDTIAVIRESGIRRGVLHCFSGSTAMASDLIGLGYHISIAGPVTFRKAGALRDVARLIPDERLLIETDAPYLCPEPFRGRRNEPAHLVHTARMIADLRGISLEDLARITTLNAQRLFRLGKIDQKAEIAYKIRDSLYLNITNRCTNACTFCVRVQTDFVKGHNLRLDHDPSEDEIREAIGDPSLYREVVFCGYGEPLSRPDTVRNISAWIKAHNGRVRINTNGQANLIHKRKVLDELAGLVDSISISLDAQDEETYARICRPAYPNAYQEVIRFIREAKEAIPDVRVTVVAMEGVDLEKCRAIAEELGVRFTVRTLDVVG
ncbi:MAG: YchF/TatD family DNA exonuclease [Nitrospiraceae bacterium]|nr:YchF/TatD family DNA exonuclease [Nitrospiraceae bacterium]